MTKNIMKLAFLFFSFIFFLFFLHKNTFGDMLCLPPGCWLCTTSENKNEAICSCNYACDVGEDECWCCNTNTCWECDCDGDSDPRLAENKFFISIDSDNSNSFTSDDQTVGYVGGTSCSEMNQTFDTPITISFSTDQDDGSTGNLFYHGLCCDNKPCSKNTMMCTSANCNYYFYISNLPDGYSPIKMSGCSSIGNGIFSCFHGEGDDEVYRILLKYTPPPPELCTIKGNHYMSDSSLNASDYQDEITTYVYDGMWGWPASPINNATYYEFNVEDGDYTLETITSPGSMLDLDGYKVCPDCSPTDVLTGIANTYGFNLPDEDGCGVQVDWYWSLKDTDPWWQTGEGDVVATGGDVISSIPEVCLTPGCVSAMGLFDADESSAGVMMCAYGSDVISGAGEISMDRDETVIPNWNASADLSFLKGYTYDFFRKKAGDLQDPDTDNNNILICSEMESSIGLEDSGNYYVWEVDSGTLEIDDCDFEDNKVIIFYNGDVKISGNINVDDGMGFFMIIAKGDINIDKSVVYGGSKSYDEADLPNIEGILFAEGSVNTGTAGDGADEPLYIRGMVAGIGGIGMKRSLEDNDAGAGQYFKFAPDLLFNYPSFLTSKNVIWREVAP